MWIKRWTVATIEPGVGAVAFCAVVLLTIIAAEAFDPRLMWDAAARNPHRPLALRQRRSTGRVGQRLAWRAGGSTGE